MFFQGIFLIDQVCVGEYLEEELVAEKFTESASALSRLMPGCYVGLHWFPEHLVTSYVAIFECLQPSQVVKSFWLAAPEKDMALACSLETRLSECVYAIMESDWLPYLAK